jgi:hypothetical protein
MSKIVYLDADDPRAQEALSNHYHDKVVYLDPDDPKAQRALKKHKSKHLKGLSLTAANSAMFNLLPKVVGIVKSAKEVDKTPQKSNKEAIKNILSGSKGHRDKIQKFLNKYAKEHKGLSTASSIVGGVVGSAAIPFGNVLKGAGIGAKVANASSRGFLHGGAGAVGKTINDDENISDNASNIVSSAVLSALMSGGVAGAGHSVENVVRGKLLNKLGIDRLTKEVGSKNISKAHASGEALLENPDEKIMMLARKIKSTGQAGPSQIFKDFKRNMEEGQRGKINHLIEKYISNKDYTQNLAKVKGEAKSIYQPAYDKAVNRGEGLDIEIDSVVPQFIRKARRYSHELRGLPDNHPKVLNKAVEKMNEEINHNINMGRESTARDILVSKKNLINQMDDKLLTYKGARESYASMADKVKNLETGYTKVPTMKLNDLEEFAGKVTPENKEEFLAGVASYFKNKNFNAPSSEANLYKNVMQEDEINRLVRLKLLDKNKSHDLNKELYKRKEAFEDVKSLNRSPGHENKKMGIEDVITPRFFTNPKRWSLIKSSQALRNIIKGKQSKSDSNVAKYLTSNKSLKAGERLLKKINKNNFKLGKLTLRTYEDDDE